MPQKRTTLIVSCLVILMVTIPYLYAFQAATTENEFGGFLINPVDGHSYLAKMQQGYQGNWKFVLTYTAEPGEGAYLFLFYIFLGHFARIINLPLITVFHSARVICAIFLLWTLNKYFGNTFDNKREQTLGFSIAALGSGLGWIAVIFGKFTSDFWVAEAYSFLSMYTNPHFSLGLGLMMLILITREQKQYFGYLGLGLAISIVQPFAVVIVVLVLGIQTVLELYKSKEDLLSKIKDSQQLRKLLAVGTGGGIFLIYQYWSILTDPVLSAWNRQNITESPDVSDLIISLSPCLILALLGLADGWRSAKGKTIVIWFISSLTLAFIPWNLQRRFLTGIFIPLAGLSVFGIEALIRQSKLNNKTVTAILFCLILPTNLIVILSGIQAASIQDSQIYQSSDLKESLVWLEGNTSRGSLVLASEKNGLYIPSISGRKVIYGHPFETINGDREKEYLEEIFGGEFSLEDTEMFLTDREFDYVLTDDESNESFMDLVTELNFPIVFSKGSVGIYRVIQP